MKAAEEEAGDKKSFGLNSLIHRMTGGARTRDVAPAPAAPRREPEAETRRPQREIDHDDGAEEDEDLRMEIPAFLRRQAN